MEKLFEFVKTHKKEVILFGSGFILCVAIVMLTTCYNTYKENQKLEKQIEKIEKKEEKKKKDTKKKEEESSNIEDVKIVENNTGTDTNTNTEVPNVVDDNYSDNIKSSDEEVISYFKEYETISNSGNTSVKDKLKNGIDTIYKFLFEGGTIKGKTFKELTNAAKLQVLKITLSIDNKIDYYFPGYKDRIKEDARNLKEKVVTKYLETTNKICTNNEDICNYAREDFKNMKESFKITWSLIKEIAKKSTTALKEWYYSI